MNPLMRVGSSPKVRCVVAAFALLLVNVAAHAQEASAAPQPALQKSPPVWLGLLVIFLMLVLVVTISLLPSKRSHQD
jgi:hypothetical protein